MPVSENSMHSVSKSSPNKKSNRSIVRILFNTSKPMIMAKYNVLDSLKTAKMMKQIEASKLKIKESIKNQKSMNIKHARSISNIQIGINHKNSQEFKEGSVNFS